MRVLFISPYLFRYFGGIERSSIQLANEFARLDHAVGIVTWSEPNKRIASPINPKIRLALVPHCRYFQALWAVPYYVNEILKGGYDVVNIYFASCGEALAIRLARMVRRFQVNFIVGYPIELVPYRFQDFRAFGLDKLLNRVIVKSPSMSPRVAEFFGRDVDVVPNGIDEEFYRPDLRSDEDLRKQFNIGDEERILLTVAALFERKGIQYGIRVLSRLLESGISVRYFVVGDDGPDGDELKDLARKLKVDDKVHFIPSLQDVRPFYQLADLFLLLSYGEGFPNVLLEAWAMGLPVIVSKHPPYPDIVPAHVGWTLKEDDLDELQKTIGRLLDSDTLREDVGQKARFHVAQYYRWPLIAQKYLDLFQKGSHR